MQSTARKPQQPSYKQELGSKGVKVAIRRSGDAVHRRTSRPTRSKQQAIGRVRLDIGIGTIVAILISITDLETTLMVEKYAILNYLDVRDAWSLDRRL
jgi:hypothetical protein